MIPCIHCGRPVWRYMGNARMVPYCRFHYTLASLDISEITLLTTCLDSHISNYSYECLDSEVHAQEEQLFKRLEEVIHYIND